MRSVIWFLVGVGISAVWMGSVWAGTPIAPTYVAAPGAVAGCQASYQAWAADNCTAPYVPSVEFPPVSQYGGSCWARCNGEMMASWNYSVVTQCPAGYTLGSVQGEPMCLTEFTDAEIACQALASIDLPVAGASAGSDSYVSGVGAQNFCSGGCAVRPAYKGTGAGGTWWAAGPWYHTGSACAANAPDVSDEPGKDPMGPEAECIKSGQGYGVLNGTVVCVPTESSERMGTKTSTNDQGGRTEVETTKTCVGDQCTVTTTTTHSGGGASGTETDGTTTRTSTGDRVSQGTGGGEGDGVGSEDDENACRENPYGADCLGPPGDQEEVGEGTGEEVGSLTPAFQSQGACPSPVALGHGWVVPFDAACDLAGLIRPLVIAFAWLAAGIYVVGGLRNG